MSPIKYGEYLVGINQKYLSDNKLVLEPLSDFLEYHDACAVVVGSNGKKEKGVNSDTEIVFIQGERPIKRLDPRLLVDEFERVNGYDYCKNFFVNKESLPRIVRIGENILSFVDDNSRLVYPDRILNSLFVCGKKTVYEQSRQIVAIEMGLTMRLSGKIRSEMKKQIKEHFKVFQTGVSRGKVCFDIDEGCQYYERLGKNVDQLGFKYGPIRLVQRDLDFITQAVIVDKRLDIERIDTLSTNTSERINYLIPDSKSLIESYLWFLQNYHRIQQEYEDNKSLCVIYYDKYDFNQNSEIILRGGLKVV